MKIFNPEGTLLSDDRTDQGSNDSSDLRMIAATDGDYRIEILGLSRQAGRYELRVEAVRPATTADLNNASAHQAWQQALRFTAENTPEGRRKAIEESWKVVGYRQANADAIGEGKARAYIGYLYFYQDDRAQAVQYLEEALVLFRAAKDRTSQAIVLTNLGAIHQETGEPLKAIEYFTQSLPVIRSTGDRYMEATVTHNLGWSHQTIGEFRKASEFYREALPLWRASTNVLGESQTLNNLGLIYSELGDPSRSVEYFETALALRRTMKDGRGEAQTLGNLAAMYADVADVTKSRELFLEALAVSQRVEDRRSQSRALIGLSYILSGQEVAQAFDYVNEALELARGIQDRRMQADALTRLGDLHRWQNDPIVAMARYQEALSLRRATGDERRTADVLFALASLLRDRRELDQAIAHAEEGLQLVESVRGRVVEPDLKTSFLASVQSYYGLAIDILMHLHEREPVRGFDVAALQISERARARGLLEALKEYQSDIRSGVEAALLDEERRIQASLNIKEQQWRSALASPQGAAKATQSRREMDALLDQFKLLQGEIRVRSPRYAALTQPESISLENLQRNLDENSVLLEYWLGYERSFLWTVTTNEVRTYVLPPARHIEQTARDYFVALSKAPPSATSKPQDHSTADAARHASSLSVTLMGPAAGTLSTKRLIIVSHGALQYLPFAALPAPASNTTTGGLLIERHEIVNLPSASVLPVLRANPAGARQQSYWLYSPTRFSPRKMHGCVVRLAPIRARSIRSCSPKTKSCSDRPAIPAWMGFVVYASAGSRRMQSLRWFPAESRFQAVDFQASRTTALSPGLADYRILHFATHGLANNVRPEFSGLVFSTVDARGKPQDGMLRLHEIFNLSLKAELVVLSACQTALGREIRGEGLIGLTRGFMHAGTPRVVASLWNVEDRATAELMKRFYEGMFKRQLKPAAALRAAQIALQQDKRWSAPYYWAGFTLQGEWQ